MLKKLYHWVLHWAETPYGPWALLLLAFSESSFFPIPPDVLLVALAISIPKSSYRYALICTAGSVMGGTFGYFLGLKLMGTVGMPIINFYGLMEEFDKWKDIFRRNDVWMVAVAGFTPVPYKVITITAGAAKLDLSNFIIVSAVSRAARFFLVGALIYRYGESIQPFIDKYFNLLSILFIALLIGGFLLIKFIL